MKQLPPTPRATKGRVMQATSSLKGDIIEVLAPAMSITHCLSGR